MKGLVSVRMQTFLVMDFGIPQSVDNSKPGSNSIYYIFHGSCDNYMMTTGMGMHQTCLVL